MIVYAGFLYSGGSNCVASADVSWDDDLVVTISDVTYSYVSGASIPATCKWRVKSSAGTIVAGYTDSGYLGDTFDATEGETYVFQACVSGPYAWGNSTDGSSHFTVTADSGGGDSGDFPDTPEVYSIKYDANGGSGAPGTHFKIEGEITYLSYVEPTKGDEYIDPYVVTLDANDGECSVASLNAVRIKYFIFGYWNTKPDGSGTTYHPGGSYTYDAPLTLYAIYLEDTVTQDVELPIPVRNGYDFLGWAISNSASSGITGTYTPTSDITFYAIWKAKGFLYIYDGTNFAAFQVFIYNGDSWDMYCPYVYDDDVWNLCS